MSKSIDEIGTVCSLFGELGTRRQTEDKPAQKYQHPILFFLFKKKNLFYY